jgi:hypothetical protein
MGRIFIENNNSYCEGAHGTLSTYTKISASGTPDSSKPSLNVVLRKGTLVTVRVIDRGQFLSSNEGKIPGAHLLLGIATDALFFRTATVISQDASTRDYQILIPFDRQLNISVTSGFFVLMDANGKALAKSGNLIPVFVPSSQQASTLVLRTIGISSP